jgi:hypothetical protein
MRFNGTAIKCVAVLLFALCILWGCNRAGNSSVRSQDSQGSPTATARDSEGASSSAMANLSASGPNRCSLLTDDDIRDAIGPHAAGANAPGNEWSLQSCRWISASGQKELADTGLIINSDWIEVGVFNPGGIGETASWAREQAEGKPVTGFVQGARYDLSSGALWFECAHDRFCVVKAHIRSGAKREQTALHLAELVEKRLR